MKAGKWISMILAAAMAMSMLAGCGTSNTTSEQTQETQTVSETEEEEAGTEETMPAETPAEDDAEAAEETENIESEELPGGKTLVVYYSANGHTEDVANTIAEAAGADLFELEPVEPYTSDDLNYSDENSRVSQEHENEDQRDVELVSTEVENWDSYETVLIGYPIWWGIAAWPVNRFVEENDFTGKTVIPFCTSASSDLGESGELLSEMAGTGDWQEGMRFQSSVSEEDVIVWVESLRLN